jgi:hypothetical protein
VSASRIQQLERKVKRLEGSAESLELALIGERVMRRGWEQDYREMKRERDWLAEKLQAYLEDAIRS